MPLRLRLFLNRLLNGELRQEVVLCSGSSRLLNRLGLVYRLVLVYGSFLNRLGLLYSELCQIVVQYGRAVGVECRLWLVLFRLRLLYSRLILGDLCGGISQRNDALVPQTLLRPQLLLFKDLLHFLLV